MSVSCSDAANDDFAAEVVKLSPAELSKWTLTNCPRLNRFALSPVTSCPALTTIEIRDCTGLESLLIQSTTLQKLILQNCPSLTKILVQAKNVARVELINCRAVTSIAVWSDEITGLDLSDCTQLLSVDLYCPNVLDEFLVVPPPPPERVEGRKHPGLVSLLREQMQDQARKQVKASERHLAILEHIPPPIVHRFGM